MRRTQELGRIADFHAGVNAAAVMSEGIGLYMPGPMCDTGCHRGSRNPGGIQWDPLFRTSRGVPCGRLCGIRVLTWDPVSVRAAPVVWGLVHDSELHDIQNAGCAQFR